MTPNRITAPLVLTLFTTYLAGISMIIYNIWVVLINTIIMILSLLFLIRRIEE